MKTVITDNSLCAFALHDKADPKHIYNYISALADAGVRYVEIDFRTVMKMTELPENIGYIFRMFNPMFAELAEVFDFNYILVTLNNMKKRIRTEQPVILEIPGVNTLSNKLFYLAQSQIDGTISEVCLRGPCDLMTPREASRLVHRLKNTVPVPIDVCPLNDNKCALDSAIKLSMASVDSLTLCMGATGKYASIEDFLFTLMSVYEALPKEFDMSALCRAAFYHRLIFRNAGGDSISNIMRLLDYDIHNLTNVDTGGRVRMPVSLRDSQYMRKHFVSAIEKMAREEGIPDDIFADLCAAMKHYDKGLYDEEILYKENKGLLN
ncbi:MAG: hypothetical protein ACI4XA_08795 [Oscillospiraceae bacterium]